MSSPRKTYSRDTKKQNHENAGQPDLAINQFFLNLHMRFYLFNSVNLRNQISCHDEYGFTFVDSIGKVTPSSRGAG